MNNQEKLQYINYCSQMNNILIDRFNQTYGLGWYIKIRNLQLKANLTIKNILGLKYKHFTNYEWKN